MKPWLAIVAVLLSFNSHPAGADSPAKLDDEVVKQVDALVDVALAGKPVTLENLDPLYRAAVLADGDVQPLLDWLAEHRGDGDSQRADSLAEIEVHVAARRGDLERASQVLTQLLEDDEVVATRVDLRIWQARLFDALGQVNQARQTYESLAKEELSETDQQQVRLRLALMGLLGDSASNNRSDAKQLIELATTSTSIDFRNRAANVLAVQNQHAEAVKLFQIQGEGTERFRSASRLAEWAIRAKDRQQSIAAAWDAVRSAELKRDRRYALALLVEAYRMEDKTSPKKSPPPKPPQPNSGTPAKPKSNPGLEELIDAFAKESREGAALNDEMRAVWVGLLRELGRHDDAIELFKASADDESGFTIEMRRELLEMEGDRGNIEGLIASYRDLVKSQPDQVVWRSGLTGVLLEQGEDQAAADLWRDHIENLDKGSQLLIAAQSLGSVGLDDLAVRAIERTVEL
ncbi:MAG: hypothetical protein MI861_18860, partial [Pirellulales bacterium]|nr:hypothetical protein [Pirellulales bacterium]